ncbi:MAG: hypothetical protein IT259_01095 [Saprospiraceae bacterium]|nr:hypothetical protein [Saprospiraceae bacterium]
MGDTQKIMLTVPASRMDALMELLRQFESVKIELLEEIVMRYVRTAPGKPVITDEEIADILMETRYGKPQETR